MKNPIIHDIWTKFITDYKEYVGYSNELWKIKLNQVKQYIDDKNSDIKQLGQWISRQKKNYNTDIKECKQIMKDAEIHNLWSQFISTNYKKI